MEKSKEQIRTSLIIGAVVFLFFWGIQLGNFMHSADSFLVQPVGMTGVKMIGAALLETVVLLGTGWLLLRRFGRKVAGLAEKGTAYKAKAQRVLSSWGFFVLLWATLFLLFMVCFLAYYPGVYAYDIHWQTAQATGYYAYSTHHPPLHTWIWSVCIRAGGGDLSHALVIYGVGQMLLLSGVLANMLRTVAIYCTEIGIVLLAVLFVCLNPVYAIFSFIMTKDVMFGALFCLFMTSFYRSIVEEKGISRQTGWKLAAEIILCCFFRKNAWLAFAAYGGLGWLGQRTRRKEYIRWFLAPVLAFLFLSGGSTFLFGMEKGSVAEALNVPMMQISYTALREWDAITPQMQERISEFISLDEIRENYDPLFADLIKDHFQLNNEMGEKKFLRFCILYAELCLKYPGDYIYSWLHLSMPYWYPVIVTDMPYHDPEYISTGIILNDSIVRQSRFPQLYRLYERIARDKEVKGRLWLYPLFSLSLPLWIMLFAICVLWAVRKYDRIRFYLPAVLLWITYVLGPVALSRYALPFMLCYPLFFSFVFAGAKK